MLNFKRFTNGTSVFNEVFINTDTKEIIFTRDCEEDNLFDNIWGFVKCLEYMKIDYDFSLHKNIELFPDDEMFRKCGFEDESFGKYKDYGNYKHKEENNISICPKCRSDEIYYDRFISKGMKHWSCYECGFEGDKKDFQNIENKLKKEED